MLNVLVSGVEVFMLILVESNCVVWVICVIHNMLNVHVGEQAILNKQEEMKSPSLIKPQLLEDLVDFVSSKTSSYGNYVTMNLQFVIAVRLLASLDHTPLSSASSMDIIAK